MTTDARIVDQLRVLDQLRAAEGAYVEGMTHRPRMYGAPSELEAMQWVLLEIRGALLGLSSIKIGDLRRRALATVANAHGWPSTVGLSEHVASSEDMAMLLVEVRAEFDRLATLEHAP